MNFHSAAIMPDSELAARNMDSPTKMTEPYFPGITLNEDALPEAKEWTMGQEYSVVLKIKMTGQRVNWEEKITTDFDILKVAVYDESANK